MSIYRATKREKARAEKVRIAKRSRGEEELQAGTKKVFV